MISPEGLDTSFFRSLCPKAVEIWSLYGPLNPSSYGIWTLWETAATELKGLKAESLNVAELVLFLAFESSCAGHTTNPRPGPVTYLETSASFWIVSAGT